MLSVTTSDAAVPQAGPQPYDEVAEERCEPAVAFARAGLGLSRYRIPVASMRVPALLSRKRSDVLAVSFHGATLRSKYRLPRFEWFRTLERAGYSALYLSDPTLDLDPRLELAWYTGTAEVDLYPALGDLVGRAARAVGASRVVLFGSSGGGLAAVQVATYVPGSVAVPFNPQTAIGAYLVNGTRTSAQRAYVTRVMPQLMPGDGDLVGGGWATPLGDRASAVLRYRRPQPNRVLFMSNINDTHHDQEHRAPFVAAATAGGNGDRLRVNRYEGPAHHNPPPPRQLLEALEAGVDWLGTTRSAPPW